MLCCTVHSSSIAIDRTLLSVIKAKNWIGSSMTSLNHCHAHKTCKKASPKRSLCIAGDKKQQQHTMKTRATFFNALRTDFAGLHTQKQNKTKPKKKWTET